MQVNVHCPIAGLPALLDPELAQCTGRFLPLQADALRSNRLRAQLQEEYPGRFLVGLSHITTGVSAALRMPDAGFWNRLDGTTAPIRFVDLQATPRLQSDAIQSLSLCVSLPRTAGVDLYNDIDGLSALICAMDVVITIDNYVAHLAGRLGRRCVVLLSTVHDWRWQLEGTTMPWYPHTSILRQQEYNDWHTVSAELMKLLERTGRV
jgi:hypothetical protein